MKDASATGVGDRIAELTARLERIEFRLAALEGGARGARATAGVEPVATRATDPAVEPATGPAYALGWLVAAERLAAGSRRLHATVYGLAGLTLAFPLLWEASFPFGFLSPGATAMAIAGVATAAVGVAWRRRLRGLAWAGGGGGALCALGLAVAHRLPVPFVGALLAIGLLTLWLGWARGWQGLAWTVAVPLDLAVLGLAVAAPMAVEGRAAAAFQPGPIAALCFGLLAVYLGGPIARTLAARAELTPGEIAQGAAAAVVGLGGALQVTAVDGEPGLTAGWVALLLGAGSYAASFAVIDRATSRRTNFIFYTTLAMTGILVACHVLLAGWQRDLALSAGAVAAMAIGAWRQRATLSLHGVVYAAFACVGSGLAGGAVSALSGPALPGPEWIVWTSAMTLAVTLVCCALPVADHGRTWGRRTSGLCRLSLLVMAVLGFAAVALAGAAPWLPLGAEGVPDPGIVATLRTAALAAAAVALAALGRSPRLAEASWLVYPVLVLAAFKLIVEDFRVGRPATLMLSLALAGAAMIVAPRLKRRHRTGVIPRGAGGGRPGPAAAPPA